MGRGEGRWLPLVHFHAARWRLHTGRLASYLSAMLYALGPSPLLMYAFRYALVIAPKFTSLWIAIGSGRLSPYRKFARCTRAAASIHSARSSERGRVLPYPQSIAFAVARSTQSRLSPALDAWP